MMRSTLLLLILLPFQLHAQDWVRTSGDVILIGLPAFTATKSLSQDMDGFHQHVNAAVATTIITYGLKWSIDKPRPDGGRFGFPSGHTSFTFAAAGFLQHRYGWAYGAPAMLLAGYTGYTRIHAERHDLWDVIAGAGIGLLTSYTLSTPIRGLELQAQGGRNQGCISARFQF